MPYCVRCGNPLAAAAEICIECGLPTMQARPLPADEISPKSFGVAVALCGVFGTVGVHHFYLGNFLHGLFDLGLFIASMYLLFGVNHSTDFTLVFIGFGLLLLDFVHTGIVFYKLIVGKQKDSSDRLVTYPGQRL